jgi:taurine dioxygenase
MATEECDVEIEPLAAALGAQIRGLNIGNISKNTEVRLRRALHEYGILVYRPGLSAGWSDDEFLRYARAYGDFYKYPAGSRYSPTEATRTPEDQVVFSYAQLSAQQARSYLTATWHSDDTSVKCPPGTGLLNCIQAPLRGGATMWANMYAAYEALSPRFQSFLDGLMAWHTTRSIQRRMGEDARSDQFTDDGRARHPVVCRDPVTSKRYLYVNANFTESISGLSFAESDSILRVLFEHINTPEFHVRWDWQPNDCVVWEERVTQHKAVANFEGKRVHRRAILGADEAPA